MRILHLVASVARVRPVLALLAVGSAGSVGAAPAARAQALAPAAYTPPPVGTRYEYSSVVNTVTRNDGWRTYFTDGSGRPGLRTALFIPDDPSAPLTLDRAALDRLWPLRLGASTEIAAKRAPLEWRWKVAVVDTETVTVPAGRFRTYVVEATEQPVITAIRPAPVNVATFWYAPALNAVVRYRTGQFVGGKRRLPPRQELLRVTTPGR
jgi:hypothetical protein